MKIDATNPFLEAQAAKFSRLKASDGSETHEAGETPDTDGASLSAGAVVSKLVAQVRQLPEVRQERVAALKKAIQSGQYQVSDRQIADALHAQLFGKDSSTK
jgi:flagellar biosynthesis anti-sigma factor FlgM